MEIFNTIQVSLELSRVQKKLHFEDPDRVQQLIDTALSCIVPRAAFRDVYPDSEQDMGVVIEGIEFRSTVLRKNLENIGRVFPFVITIGDSLEQQAAEYEDLLDRYLLDKIGDLILIQARRQLQNHLQQRYGFKKLSSMSPGSLPDWPLQEQEKLFSLLGDVQGRLGVGLNESLLMLPRKSVSGMYFPTEVTFFSCQLCPRQNCEERKAAFDESKVEEYGLQEQSRPGMESKSKVPL
ncbi:MAG: vitamin B12 dependent-methionine synthase activation domain-containing protein [Thermodesulfobacteriota bacterium]